MRAVVKHVSTVAYTIRNALSVLSALLMREVIVEWYDQNGMKLGTAMATKLLFVVFVLVLTVLISIVCDYLFET